MTHRAWLAAVAVAVAVAGCSLTRPPLERSTYALGATRAGAPAAEAMPVTLRVRPFRAAAPYDGRDFLYRTPDGQLVADFYNVFPAGPGELVTQATTQWLRAAGLFAAVIEPGVTVDTAYALEGSLVALYGDLADPQRPAAVLDVQVYLVRTTPAGRVLALDRRFTERVAVAERSPQALARGFNEALARVLARLERELAAADLRG
jgi:ABC-type uncharacterized transport system auxiliary subunit